MKTEHELFLMRQEHLYYNSNLTYKEWYRKLFGGDWKLIKMGKDTPSIRLFCVWTNTPLEWWSGGHITVLEKESYPETGVDTKWKLFKEFFKQKFSK